MRMSDDILRIAADDIGERLVCLDGDDLHTITFYVENEVALTIPQDGIGAFVAALKVLVRHAEYGEDDWEFTPQTHLHAIATVKAALGE